MLDNLPNGLSEEDLDHIYGCGSEEERKVKEDTKAFLEDLEVDYLRGK